MPHDVPQQQRRQLLLPQLHSDLDIDAHGETGLYEGNVVVYVEAKMGGHLFENITVAVVEWVQESEAVLAWLEVLHPLLDSVG